MTCTRARCQSGATEARERQQLLQTAEHYLRSGKQALARMALESLVAVDASSSRAFELLGYVCGSEGRLAEAQGCLEKATRLPRPSPEAFHYLGVSLLKQGRAEPAIRAFDKALALAGPFFEALHERVTACSRLRRHAQALQSYLQAAKLRPGSFDLVFNIGKVYDELKDFGNALAWYDRGLALAPDAAEVLAHRGALLFDAGRLAEAIDSWDRALAIDPRIEHLSADFSRHAVSYLLADLCELHDRQSFKTFAFTTNRAALDIAVDLVGHTDNDAVKDNLRREAARAGVDPGRLVFGGRLPMAEYLDRYRHAGLFLDTLPFNGGATANDAPGAWPRVWPTGPTN